MNRVRLCVCNVGIQVLPRGTLQDLQLALHLVFLRAANVATEHLHTPSCCCGQGMESFGHLP